MHGVQTLGYDLPSEDQATAVNKNLHFTEAEQDSGSAMLAISSTMIWNVESAALHL